MYTGLMFIVLLHFGCSSYGSTYPKHQESRCLNCLCYTQFSSCLPSRGSRLCLTTAPLKDAYNRH